MEPEIVIQEGFRRGTALLHGVDGHSYHFNRLMSNGRFYYRCHLYYKLKCKGSATVGVDGTFVRGVRHRHQRSHNLAHERRLRHAILNRCRAGDLQDFKVIYHEERRRLRTPADALKNVPFVTMRPAMDRARREGLPALPHSLSDLATTLRLNPHLTESSDGTDNIFAGVVGSSRQGTRCILFMSERMRQHLSSVTRVFTDATFIVPANLGCAQIWNLVQIRRETHPHIICLGSVLMQRKLKAAYQSALRGLKHLVPTWRPREWMMDFEQAEQGAIQVEFPAAECRGCHFHFTKAVCENAKEQGLVPLLRDNEDADRLVRSLCALPLLRREDIREGFMTLLDEAINLNLEELTPLFTYFCRTWLIPSRIRVLSVHNCKYRTSNACESLNRTLRAEVKRNHPNIYHLIQALVNMEDNSWMDLQILNAGGDPSVKRRSSALANDRRIKNLTEDFEAGEIDMKIFLRSVSRRIQGVYDDILHN